MPIKPDIPNFEITAYCGSGAYGDVWKGIDRDGVQRAVKVLDIKRLESLGVLQREEKAIKLFRTQGQRHSNLIEIFYSGETEQNLYYIMALADNLSNIESEYIPNTLSERLKLGKPLSVEQCLNIINQILDAVEQLHKNNLLHRDIKPSNVLFIDDIAKLADIGLVSSSNSEISIAGTPGFIPPEGNMGPESDLYALGKLLYCMYTGKIADEFPSLPDCGDNPIALKQLKQINRVILKACDKASGNRFRSVDEFRQALIGNLPRRKIRTRLVLEVILLIITVVFAGAYWCGHYMKYSRKRKSHHWLTLAHKNAAEGHRNEALRNTEQALNIYPDNDEAASLRKLLIQQFWNDEAKPETSKKSKSPVLSSVERKEYAQYLILYNTFMTKGNPQKALECIELINKKWPHMKKSASLKKLRTYALNKLQVERNAEKIK